MSERNNKNWLSLTSPALGQILFNLDNVESITVVVTTPDVAADIHIMKVSGDEIIISTTTVIAAATMNILVGFFRSNSNYVAYNLAGPAEITY